jgi:hypothetical protein
MERTPNATQDEGNFAGPNCGLFHSGVMEYRFLMRGASACWGLFEVAPQLFF